MRKIDATVLITLSLMDFVFKYPFSDGAVENNFDPKINDDFKKYYLTQINGDGVRVNIELTYSLENSKTNFPIKKVDFLDGTWWAFPERIRISS